MDDAAQNNRLNQLTIVETDHEFLVVWNNDLADWVARFQKDDGFPAEMWVKRMVELYADQDSNKGKNESDTRSS